MVNHISIHAPREGSDFEPVEDFRQAYISIHAPREGSDFHPASCPICDLISIHAPREGSDVSLDLCVYIVEEFQSTLPVKGATIP